MQKTKYYCDWANCNKEMSYEESKVIMFEDYGVFFKTEYKQRSIHLCETHAKSLKNHFSIYRNKE